MLSSECHQHHHLSFMSSIFFLSFFLSFKHLHLSFVATTALASWTATQPPSKTSQSLQCMKSTPNSILAPGSHCCRPRPRDREWFPGWQSVPGKPSHWRDQSIPGTWPLSIESDSWSRRHWNRWRPAQRQRGARVLDGQTQPTFDWTQTRTGTRTSLHSQAALQCDELQGVQGARCKVQGARCNNSWTAEQTRTEGRRVWEVHRFIVSKSQRSHPKGTQEKGSRRSQSCQKIPIQKGHALKRARRKKKERFSFTKCSASSFLNKGRTNQSHWLQSVLSELYTPQSRWKQMKADEWFLSLFELCLHIFKWIHLIPSPHRRRVGWEHFNIHFTLTRHSLSSLMHTQEKCNSWQGKWEGDKEIKKKQGIWRQIRHLCEESDCLSWAKSISWQSFICSHFTRSCSVLSFSFPFLSFS